MQAVVSVAQVGLSHIQIFLYSTKLEQKNLPQHGTELQFAKGIRRAGLLALLSTNRPRLLLQRSTFGHHRDEDVELQMVPADSDESAIVVSLPNSVELRSDRTLREGLEQSESLMIHPPTVRRASSAILAWTKPISDDVEVRQERSTPPTCYTVQRDKPSLSV